MTLTMTDITDGDVTVTASIDPGGRVRLDIHRGGKLVLSPTFAADMYSTFSIRTLNSISGVRP